MLVLEGPKRMIEEEALEIIEKAAESFPFVDDEVQGSEEEVDYGTNLSLTDCRDLTCDSYSGGVCGSSPVQ